MSLVDQKHFEVVVRGQYHALHSSSGTPTLKNYEETFVLPSQEAALSNICKHLLAPRLRKSKPDFIRFRTHELVSITLKGYKPNADVLQMGIDEMNMEELSDFCILRQILIDPYKHGSKSIDQIREMIQKAYTAKRQTAKDMRESKTAIADQEADTLRKANDLEPQSQSPKININEHKATAANKEKDKAQSAATQENIEPADEALPPIEQDAAAEPVLE